MAIIEHRARMYMPNSHSIATPCHLGSGTLAPAHRACTRSPQPYPAMVELHSSGSRTVEVEPLAITEHHARRVHARLCALAAVVPSSLLEWLRHDGGKGAHLVHQGGAVELRRDLAHHIALMVEWKAPALTPLPRRLTLAEAPLRPQPRCGLRHGKWSPAPPASHPWQLQSSERSHLWLQLRAQPPGHGLPPSSCHRHRGWPCPRP